MLPSPNHSSCMGSLAHRHGCSDVWGVDGGGVGGGVYVVGGVYVLTRG